MATANKGVKITYWITTILLALFILPGIFSINSKLAIDGAHHLLIPEWLRYEVSIAQFIGGLLLIIPLPKRLKEWGYVGIGIVYISAFIGHVAIDGLGKYAFMALLMFAILLVSYLCYHKMHSEK
jgi:uncharacterized membrane protein YphA (DoxX/SURF4 family)